MNIPTSHADLIGDATKAHAYLATTMPDGTPQVTPVWFNAESDHILVNTAIGRVKDRNMRDRPRVALLIADPRDALRYIQVRGRVVDFTENGALAHINNLSMKYHGRAWSPVAGQVRVIFKIQPEHISVS
jgi:PPOX class probable F420-dependent enzyme